MAIALSRPRYGGLTASSGDIVIVLLRVGHGASLAWQRLYDTRRNRGPRRSRAVAGRRARDQPSLPTPSRRGESRMSSTRPPVAVVVGATSKWQADGRNTKLAHGKALDDRDLPVGIRWGVGGAIAQKFAREGFFVVLTTRA